MSSSVSQRLTWRRVWLASRASAAARPALTWPAHPATSCGSAPASRADLVAGVAVASAIGDYPRLTWYYPDRVHSYVRRLGALHADWEHDARIVVASLRMEAAKDPGDPELAILIGDLSVQAADFRTWWASHQVAGAGYGAKHYRHPLAGDLTLDCDTWGSPDGSGQRLMVLTTEPGTPSHERLRILASWHAEPHAGLGAGRPSEQGTDA
jgi:MmyB-like transcription regulator ligand binding domain